VLGRRRPGADVDDIAAAIVERFLADSESIMSSYPEPAAYARVAAHRGGITFDRHERAQRGQGVRLTTGEDGSLAPKRSVVSGDELFHLHIGVDAADDEIVRRLDAASRLERCLSGISVEDRQLLYLVDGVGYTVNEVAQVLGQRRETVSRRLNRARRVAQGNRARIVFDGALDAAV